MFVHIYAEMLEQTNAAVNCEHIPGDMNNIADDMSRPATHLSPSDFHKQLCHKYAFLQSWKNFQPRSPALLYRCYSLGCTAHNGRARPYFQSRWDVSFPRHPLLHIPVSYEVGTRLGVGTGESKVKQMDHGGIRLPLAERQQCPLSSNQTSHSETSFLGRFKSATTNSTCDTTHGHFSYLTSNSGQRTTNASPSRAQNKPPDHM
jgi:hypothetical protein